MSRHGTIGTTATTITRASDGSMVLTYHQTAVVTVRPDGVVVLCTGGWRTQTTKARMNQAATEWRLGFGVRQEKGEWYIWTLGKPDVLFEGRVMHRNAQGEWLPGFPEEGGA